MNYNKRIIHTFFVVATLMMALVCWLTYFQLIKAPVLATIGSNPRTGSAELLTKRGSIYDSAQTVLASSDGTGEAQVRNYPFNDLYAHVVGYSSRKYGKTMLENTQNGYLLGLNAALGVMTMASGNDNKVGADIYLTISHSLQKQAKQALTGKTGSIVALNPSTGEILAMYSNPSFNPNEKELVANWSALLNDENSPLLFRATNGMYPPGSVFKVITAAAAIEAGYGQTIFDDTGAVEIDGYEFKNFNNKVLGQVSLEDAFAHSLNTVFAKLGEELGAQRLGAMAERFMINKPIPFDIYTEESKLFTTKPGKTTVAAAGIGQGDLMVTPLNMALVAAAIANNGVMMKPYMVKNSVYGGNLNLYNATPEVLSRAVSPDVAQEIAKYMQKTVQSGTGSSAQIKVAKVAGKTGTAENEGKRDHSWFICFAPAEKPTIAVCVMVENAGTGAEVAAPIAASVIKSYLEKK